MEQRSARVLDRRRRARPAPATDQQAKEALSDVRRIIGAEPQPVARILPEAVVQATAEREAALAAALEPAVGRAVRVFASRESEWFGEILSPTIGVAVRKAVAAALAALMQRFNEALERSISIQSVKWRVEARRTGRPFAEVVLLHTLVYRVEQAFLIHTNTGLVLQHVVAEGAPSADPDQVASMLSAIDSFGREAFEPKSAGVHLHEFALGDLTVWIDRGASIAVAVVVRGRAPRSLLGLMAETRERIVLEHGAAIAGFVSDVAPFGTTRPLLEQCLREQRTEARRRGPVILAALAVIIVAALAAGLVRGHYRSVAHERQLAAYRHALETEPGVIVTSAAFADDRYRFGGLRDPMARTTAELAARLGHPPVELSFGPFYSLDPRIIEERARRALQPPPDVRVEVNDGTVRLSGEAPHGWVDQALPRAAALPGVERVDSWVSDATVSELGSLTRALEETAIHFERGSSRLDPQLLPVIEQATQRIARASALSAELRLTTCVTVIGGADETGPGPRNAVLAASRAATVLVALRDRTPALVRAMVRARARDIFDVGPRARSVRFQVDTRPDSPEASCREGTGR